MCDDGSGIVRAGSGNNATPRLCRHCAARPENAGWNGRRWNVLPPERIDRVRQRHADILVSAPDYVSACTELAAFGRVTVARVRWRWRDGRRVRVVEAVERALTVREIAAAVGVSRMTAWRVLRSA